MGKHTIVGKATRIAEALWEEAKDNSAVSFNDKRGLLESFIKLSMLEAKFNPPEDEGGSFAEIIKDFNGSSKNKRAKGGGEESPPVNPFATPES